MVKTSWLGNAITMTILKADWLITINILAHQPRPSKYCCSTSTLQKYRRRDVLKHGQQRGIPFDYLQHFGICEAKNFEYCRVSSKCPVLLDIFRKLFNSSWKQFIWMDDLVNISTHGLIQFSLPTFFGFRTRSVVSVETVSKALSHFLACKLVTNLNPTSSRVVFFHKASAGCGFTSGFHNLWDNQSLFKLVGCRLVFLCCQCNSYSVIFVSFMIPKSLSSGTYHVIRSRNKIFRKRNNLIFLAWCGNRAPNFLVWWDWNHILELFASVFACWSLWFVRQELTKTSVLFYKKQRAGSESVPE